MACQQNPQPIPDYNLVWRDEFNGSLDSQWEIVESVNYNWINCAIRENVYTENGNLVTRMKGGSCPNNSIIISILEWLQLSRHGYMDILRLEPN